MDVMESRLNVNPRCNSLCTLHLSYNKLRPFTLSQQEGMPQLAALGSASLLCPRRKQLGTFPLQPLAFIPQHANLPPLGHGQILSRLDLPDLAQFTPDPLLLATEEGTGILGRAGEGWFQRRLELLQPGSGVRDLCGFGGHERLGALH